MGQSLQQRSGVGADGPNAEAASAVSADIA